MKRLEEQMKTEQPKKDVELPVPQSVARAVTQSNVAELQDRERGKKNLVLFNLPEAECTDTEDRKLFDIAEAVELLKELGVESDVDRPVRLGPKMSDAKYPRPLRITVGSEEIKWNVLKQAKNLQAQGKEKYSTVYIKRDMTRLERDQDQQLRNDLAARRREEGEKGGTRKWTIWKGKVVQCH